jgi:hypothetical protein
MLKNRNIALKILLKKYCYKKLLNAMALVSDDEMRIGDGGMNYPRYRYVRFWRSNYENLKRFY